MILVSGYHDSSDVWNQSDVLSPVGSAVPAPVQETLAASGRVCSYDRPGTVRYIEGAPLTDRSTPVTQPRTAADIVAELDQALTAATVPKPYVLVGTLSADCWCSFMRRPIRTRSPVWCSSMPSVPRFPRPSATAGRSTATSC